MPVILNIDFDVFYNTDQDTTLSPNKILVVCPHTILTSLRIAEHTVPFLCLDHHEALAEWDRRELRHAVCIHMDAHHDLHTDFNRSWEVPFATRGRHIGAGDYLFHALREGMIDSLIWVAPSWVQPAHAAQDIRKRLGPTLSSRITIVTLQSFHWDLPAATMVSIAFSPEWTPRRDLLIAEDFARKLNGAPRDIQQWTTSAENRYDTLTDPQVQPLDLRFRFPTASVERRDV